MDEEIICNIDFAFYLNFSEFSSKFLAPLFYSYSLGTLEISFALVYWAVKCMETETMLATIYWPLFIEIS